jgi:holo-[acyl-carrier protein] synthase
VRADAGPHQEPAGPDLAATPGLRVGVDVMAIGAVAESIARFGSRYLRRVYTDHELESSAGAPPVRAARLAARFAAKEATVKVLRPSGHRPDWRAIEVRRHPGGWCDLVLSGEAAALAAEQGIGTMAVSLSHEAGVAAAVVVATCAR